jgi:hypothetical protein
MILPDKSYLFKFIFYKIIYYLILSLFKTTYCSFFFYKFSSKWKNRIKKIKFFQLISIFIFKKILYAVNLKSK